MQHTTPLMTPLKTIITTMETKTATQPIRRFVDDKAGERFLCDHERGSQGEREGGGGEICDLPPVKHFQFVGIGISSRDPD